MRRNIFISYKHKDKDVMFMLDKPKGTRPGDYARYLKNYVLRQDQVHEEELGDEDLRGREEEYIHQRLRAKLDQVDLLVILLTPWMRELDREPWEQWLTREINYALGGDGGRRRAVVGVVLPDKHGSYAYYKRQMHRGELLPILAANIKNGYIHISEWDSFKNYPGVAIYGADLRRENIPDVAVDGAIGSPINLT